MSVAGGGVSVVGDVLSGLRLSFDVDGILALACFLMYWILKLTIFDLA